MYYYLLSLLQSKSVLQLACFCSYPKNPPNNPDLAFFFGHFDGFGEQHLLGVLGLGEQQGGFDGGQTGLGGGGLGGLEGGQASLGGGGGGGGGGGQHSGAGAGQDFRFGGQHFSLSFLFVFFRQSTLSASFLFFC